MKCVLKTNSIYRMSWRNTPALTVAAGETFCVQTEDCYSGNLRTTKDVFTKEMWSTVNPATGPIFIKGAKPGMVLRVDIKEIKTRPNAVMCVEHGAGAMGDKIKGVETTIHPIRAGKLVFSKKLQLPIAPMLGVLGVAPEKGAILNGTPGEHGGNMDCREIGAGSSVFLPVYHEGALLAMGDIHALMGDGEVVICGAETSGEILLRAQPLRRMLPTPCVVTGEDIMFLASAKKLDQCEPMVLDKAHRFLTGVMKLKPNEAGRLMSLVGQLRVSQVVDPLKTMKFMLPLKVLKELGWQTRMKGLLRQKPNLVR